MSKQSLMIKLRDSKTVRFFSFPFARTARKLQIRSFQKSEEAEYFARLKDSHYGERCFVIGNGPSLRPEDLDILSDAGEVCFGLNRIYNIFPHTKWRPTFYLCLDTPVVSAELENIASIGDYQKIINYNFIFHKKSLPENIHYLCTYSPFVVDPFKMAFNSLSYDLTKYGTKTGTVTANAIELAIYMGFKTIYLLGVDHSYPLQRLKDGKIHVNLSAKSSYFQGMKESKTLGESVQTVESSETTYTICKKFAEDHGVKICNATRGGKLEIFERVDFDSLFSAD